MNIKDKIYIERKTGWRCKMSLDSKGEITMELMINKITIENKIINKEQFFALGFCPEIKRYLLCVHISWIAGYDRYYVIDEDDIAVYKDNQQLFCQKYAKEIDGYRTEKLIGAGALRDYDFSVLPDEILKRLNRYPSFKGYCYTNGILYAQIKIEDYFFTLPPIYDKNR